MFSVVVLFNRLSSVVPVLLRSKQPVLPAGVRWRSLSRTRMPKNHKVCLFLLLYLIFIFFQKIIIVRSPNLVPAGPRAADRCWSRGACRSLSGGSGQERSRDRHRARQARLQTQQRHRFPPQEPGFCSLSGVYQSFCLLQLFPQRRWKWPSLLLQWMEKPTWSSSASWLRFWSWRKATYIWTRFLWKCTDSPNIATVWCLVWLCVVLRCLQPFDGWD